MTKFYVTAVFLFALLFCGSTAFSQTAAPTKIVCYATPPPQGPLYVLVFKKKTRYTMDGKVIGSIVNPNTIKSINIQKDAKATAIYGSRAANGVVIIEIDKKHARKEYNRLKPHLDKF
ncbi:TonB-dependent receptor plug domain-containing protein [Pedobacter africanus]|uniref:TonB-dependent receptor plug domain-containing protein n=1 Tax=Pedobacter africanus TaxID=151894 RepID=UPI000A015204|nr:TonB-dependent receptor plug domain-containing protein [Pedobacter africanus]